VANFREQVLEGMEAINERVICDQIISKINQEDIKTGTSIQSCINVDNPSNINSRFSNDTNRYVKICQYARKTADIYWLFKDEVHSLPHSLN
jgi:hypothetical protein